jgi:hypothetical protein
MIKIIQFLIISTLFISCNKNSDSFSNIKFGSISKDLFLKEMLNNKTFTVFNDNKVTTDDTTSIGYVLKNGGKEFPMTVYFNEENSDHKYHIGSLRRMGFWIGEDKNEYGRTWRSSGKISKEFVDDLFDTYVDFYGKPDSLILQHKYEFNLHDIFHISKVDKKDPKNIDKRYLSGKRAVWTTDNFKLVFDIPFIEKPTSKNEKIYYKYGSDIKILFEMIGYEKEFKRVQDSIAKNLIPNDLVYITTGNCEWTKNLNNYNNTRLNIKLSQINRIDFDEERSIKGVRLDLVITDSFKEELYKAENLTIELPERSYLESREKKGEMGLVRTVDLNRTYWADFNSLNDPKLAFLKKYSENNKVNIKAVIKTILFEDGTILNSK